MPPTSPISEAPNARHLGDLARSEARWSVYLETRPRGQGMAGRVHFLQGARRRTTGWIFLEWSEQAVLDRFNDFSPLELWKILESLG
ncbi:MAG: hypothetical protein AB7Q69_10790 [Gemmatimonadales bacterium]